MKTFIDANTIAAIITAMLVVFAILKGDSETGGTLTKPLCKLARNTWNSFWYWTVGD